MGLPYLDSTTAVVLAHRGFSTPGLENSLAAVQAAVDLGCDYVETDVHATTDGVAISFHDDSLGRVTDRVGMVADLPHPDVLRPRIGGIESVPTMEEVLTTWPELRINIDVKAPRAVVPTARLVSRLGAHDRVCIGSFSDRRRRATLAAMDRRVAMSEGSTVVRAFQGATRLGSRAMAARARRGVGGLQVPVQARGITVLSPRSVEWTASLGVPVHVWTVNERTEMHRLLDMGVAGLVTDRADIGLDVVAGRP